MDHRDSQFITGRIGLWTNTDLLAAFDSLTITQEDAEQAKRRIHEVICGGTCARGHTARIRVGLRHPFCSNGKSRLARFAAGSTISQSISSAIGCLWPSSKTTPWPS